MRSLDIRKALLGILFLFRFLPVWTSSLAMLSLELNSTTRLEVGDTLVSPSGHFEFGIFSIPENQEKIQRYLCIRYAAPIQQVVVWVANRNSPLTSSKSFLELSNSDGILKLNDPDNKSNKLPWSTTGNGWRAKLLDTGNLVLMDKNETRIWDSFNSSITNTLLPGQYLYKTDNRQNSLTSWSGKDNPGSGDGSYYTFGWVGDKSSLQLAWTAGDKNMSWPGGAFIPAPDEDNPHTISNVSSVYFHPDLAGLYFPRPSNTTPDNPLLSASTVILSDFQRASNTTLRRLTLDLDGGLRIWQFTLKRSKEWTPVANWVVKERGSQCFTVGTCGKLGLCQTNPPGSLDLVHCTCPDGFQRLPGNEVGCTATAGALPQQDCTNPLKVRFLVLAGFDLPWGGDYENKTWDSSDVSNHSVDCQTLCLNNCSCTGAVYSMAEQVCWMKQGSLYNLGYPTEALHGNDRTAYIKISTEQPAPPPGKSKLGVILAAVLGGFCAVCFGTVCAYKFRKSLCGRVRKKCGGMCTRWTSPSHHEPSFSGSDSEPRRQEALRP